VKTALQADMKRGRGFDVTRFPGREHQCQQIYELLDEEELCLPLLVHGPCGGGKSSIVRSIVEHFQIPTAYIDCVASPSDRSIYESILNQLAQHTPSTSSNFMNWSQCSTPATFIASMRQIARARRGRLCIILDKAERLGRNVAWLQTLLSVSVLCEEFAVNIIFVAATAFPDESISQWTPMADFSCMLRVYFPGYTQPQLMSVIKRDACNVVARAKNMKTRPNHTPRAFDDVGGTHRLHARTPVLGPASSPQPVPLMVSADLAAAFEEFTCTFVNFFSAVCRDTHELRHLARELFPKYIKPAVIGDVPLSNSRQLFQEARQLLRVSLRQVYSRHGTHVSVGACFVCS